MDLLWLGLYLCVFLVFLIGLEVLCDDFLVPSLKSMSKILRIPDDVASATVLAFGASAAEITLSCVATLHGTVELSIGALTGSGIIAFTVIPAASVWVTKKRVLVMETKPLLRDCGFFLVTLACLIGFAKMNSFGVVENLAFIACFFVYLATLLCCQCKSEPHMDTEQHKTYGTVGDEEDQQSVSSVESFELFEEWPFTIVSVPWKKLFTLFVDRRAVRANEVFLWPTIFSTTALVLISEGIVNCTIGIANETGMSHHIAGLTLLALGTQVEDIFATVAIAKTGDGSSAMAVSIASQILNILLGLGAPFLTFNLLQNKPIHISDSQVDGIIAAALLLLVSVIFFLMLSFRSNFCFCTNEKPVLTISDAILLTLTYFLVTTLAVLNPKIE